jgi:HlyD family secretion protein
MMRIRSFAPFALLLLGAACGKKTEAVVFQAVPVERRSIVVSARASGTVQPDTVVEVKSKASGEILEMRVETGQTVERGTLLVRVDQRTPRNRLNQAQADLDVAKARFENAEAQRKRSDELFKTQSISTEEHETAVLAVANARAVVVGAQVALENAKIAMEDTDVRAPISGTIISKSVERGQVISSPTSDVGGGTVLLKMADLNLVQVRTLVDETDIGKIRAGLRATVTVGSYPNQPFEGSVLKIEPLAETVQNVTMFAVQVRIENRNGLLKPGMNADVEVHIGQRDSVLAVPNAALRTPRDVVDRVRHEREHEPERRGEDERGDDVARPRAGREPVGRVLPDAPPEEQADEEVRRVFEREQPVGTAERRVVERRDVPERVRPDPERQRDEGLGQRSHAAWPGQPPGEHGRDPEHEQERRPLREHDVLQQVCPDEIRARERVERRHERRDEQPAAGEERRRPRPIALAPRGGEVPGRERERHERLRAPRPCPGRHGATLRRARVYACWQAAL